MKARRSTAPVKISQTHERALEITLRDVKNEDRPGYVYENTGDADKMSREKHGFLHENCTNCAIIDKNRRVFSPKMHNHTINRSEVRPFEPASPKMNYPKESPC